MPPPGHCGACRAELNARPLHQQVDLIVAVAAGGAVGTAARYGLGMLLPTAAGSFPWGTLVVNVSGSFALSVLVVIIVERLEEGTLLARYLRPVAAVGFLGAYTTYSTYAVEVDSAIRDGHPALAVLYAAGTLTVGVAATCGGLLTGRLLDALGPETRHPDVAAAGGVSAED